MKRIFGIAMLISCFTMLKPAAMLAQAIISSAGINGSFVADHMQLSQELYAERSFVEQRFQDPVISLEDGNFFLVAPNSQLSFCSVFLQFVGLEKLQQHLENNTNIMRASDDPVAGDTGKYFFLHCVITL
ncbi:MAG: hypothetical protein R2794_12735 [Chitinophagales bacterium]